MSVRLVIWMASGTLVAAGLAACGDEPPVAKGGKGGDQATSQSAAQLAVVAAPQATAAVDENAALAARVLTALRRHPTVGTLEIDVVSADGAVTLFGTAPTAGDREKAAKVAAGVDGVRSVMNNLVIVSGS